MHSNSGNISQWSTRRLALKSGYETRLDFERSSVQSRWWFLKGPWRGFSVRGGIRHVKMQSSTSHRLSRICISISLPNLILYYVGITTVRRYTLTRVPTHYIIITNGGGVRDRRLTGPIRTRVRVPTLRPRSCQSREKHRRQIRGGTVDPTGRRRRRPRNTVASRIDRIFLLFGLCSLAVSPTLRRPYTATSRMLLLHIRRRRSVNNGRSGLYNTAHISVYIIRL